MRKTFTLSIVNRGIVLYTIWGFCLDNFYGFYILKKTKGDSLCTYVGMYLFTDIGFFC